MNIIDGETWEIVVKGAQRQNHVILSNGPPDRSYGFAVYADRSNTMIDNQSDSNVNPYFCFRCKEKHWQFYYEWIFDSELKDEKAPLGGYRQVCKSCVQDGPKLQKK